MARSDINNISNKHGNTFLFEFFKKTSDSMGYIYSLNVGTIFLHLGLGFSKFGIIQKCWAH